MAHEDKAMKHRLPEGVPVYDSMPDGWQVIEGAQTAPVGYAWINNRKSVFSKEYKHGLIKNNYYEVRNSRNQSQD